MKIERTKNAVRNIRYGIILKIYQIIMPFILRTVMIYYLGIEYIGLNSLFASILSVLNIAELGVGTAIVYSMYQPIAEDDEEKICALMRLYKIYYRIIGMIILIGGLIVMPFLPHLISGDVPNDINIYLIFGINLLSTILSYWLFAYKSCLFSAHQRGDISSKISIFISLFTYFLQFIILIFYRNYYLYLLIGVCTQVLQNIIAAIVATKNYPRYNARGKLDKEVQDDINQRVIDLFTSKIGGIILNSVDTIVISIFLGVTTLGIYNNYYYIMASVIGFIEVVYGACIAGIGNSIITETKEKNFKDFNTFTFIISWISICCCCCFLNLYQPFMKIWMNGNQDMMLDFEIVICLSIYFFVYQINRVANVYKDAAGIWHRDRFRPLVTAGFNLTLNIILVQYMGLYGVILSTVIATVFVNYPWLYSNIFNSIFEKYYIKEYVLSILKFIILCTLILVISYGICCFIPMDGIFMLFIRLIICLFVPNVLLWLFLRKNVEFINTKMIMINRIKSTNI